MVLRTGYGGVQEIETDEERNAAYDYVERGVTSKPVSKTNKDADFNISLFKSEVESTGPVRDTRNRDDDQGLARSQFVSSTKSIGH
jgi:hypothetical protein